MPTRATPVESTGTSGWAPVELWIHVGTFPCESESAAPGPGHIGAWPTSLVCAGPAAAGPLSPSPRPRRRGVRHSWQPRVGAHGQSLSASECPGRRQGGALPVLARTCPLSGTLAIAVPVRGAGRTARGRAILHNATGRHGPRPGITRERANWAGSCVGHQPEGAHCQWRFGAPTWRPGGQTHRERHGT